MPVLQEKARRLGAALSLTEVVCTAEVEDVTAVNVMVQRFLNQVLGLITCKLCHPEEDVMRRVERTQSYSDILERIVHASVYE